MSLSRITESCIKVRKSITTDITTHRCYKVYRFTRAVPVQARMNQETVLQAPCKRKQQYWPTTSNIVGCYMLCPFAHPVACCCVLLGVVAQSLKPVKLLATCNRTQQLRTLLANNVGSCCVRLHAALQGHLPRQKECKIGPH